MIIGPNSGQALSRQTAVLVSKDVRDAPTENSTSTIRDSGLRPTRKLHSFYPYQPSSRLLTWWTGSVPFASCNEDFYFPDCFNVTTDTSYCP
jgi:hypothetical protein